MAKREKETKRGNVRKEENELDTAKDRRGRAKESWRCEKRDRPELAAQERGRQTVSDR